jgi:hypothetical protein
MVACGASRRCDRVKTLAPQHPDWITREPFTSLPRAIWQVSWHPVARGVLEIMAAGHAGTGSFLGGHRASYPFPADITGTP